MKRLGFLLCLPLCAGNLPRFFEPNLGQTSAPVQFLARLPGYTLFVTSNEVVFAETNGSVERMRFLGANNSPRIEPLDRLPGISNYFLGNDPSKWRSGIPHYARFALRGVYPGVDLVFHTSGDQLEYDWVVAPGADPKQIRVEWSSPTAISQTTQGDLILSAALRQKKPAISQSGANIAGGYALDRKRVSFNIARYDHSKTLLIDPVVLLYSTYLGGSAGDPAPDLGDGGDTLGLNLVLAADTSLGIAADAAGNTYLTGLADSSDFPTAGALQKNYKGHADAFVTKLNASGSALVYSTYLGGSNADTGFAIAVDPSGNAYLAGVTTSNDFPTVNPFQAAPKSNMNSGFVSKLNPSGSALVFSTYLNGSGNDIAFAIAVDSNGSAYVAGSTSSGDFPVVNALQPSFPVTDNTGGDAGFISKLSPSGSSLIYSTFLGGSSGDDAISAVALDSAGNAYVTGSTGSNDFPVMHAVQGNLNGTENAFVSKINAAGNTLLYSTYLGGSDSDGGFGIAVDSSGSAYVLGTANSNDFPTTSNAFQPHKLPGAGANAFVAKLNPTGASLAYSTFLGGSGVPFGDAGFGIAVDAAGNAHVGGMTGSKDFPTANALQKTFSGGALDIFVSELNPTGSALIYSTYLGGSGNDLGGRVALDAQGNTYVSGWTFSTNFPTFDPFQSQNLRGAQGAAFVTAIAAFPPGNTSPTSLTITGGNRQAATASTALPAPLTVSVTSSSGAGVSGVTVNFAVASGSGTLSAASVLTDSTGAASVTLTLGPNAGIVTVTASIANSTIPAVTFTETATASSTCPLGPPSISSVNSASDFGGFSNFASGSYLEVKGSNLAIDARQWAGGDFQGSAAPNSLDGSKVTINGIPGFVSYISGQQINVQAPADSATGLVAIAVTNCAGSSNTFMLQKSAIAPGILAPASFNLGKQYVAALFADDLAQGLVTFVGNTGLIAGANFRPAKPGDVIVFYGLGFGAVTPATGPGLIASGATNLAGLSISFGSTPAAGIGYAGLYPGFVGLYEFYVTVPNVSGDVQLNISVNGTPVQQTLFVTVQQ